MIQTTNKTKLLGIIGTPLEHTLSPKMHSYLAQKNDQDMAYLAFDVQKQGFKQIIDATKQMGALGFNITAPYKIDVMDCIDVVDTDAKIMDSVNTIVNKNGKWYGYNTDGDGFVDSLELDGITLFGKHILILGSGGSARSICYKFAKKNVESITIHARNEKNASMIGDMISNNSNTKYFYALNETQKYDIIVNTTPIGMLAHENANSFERMDFIDSDTVVCDIIYNPRKTILLQEAQKRGARIVNGLNMLILQGIYAFGLFSGKDMDVSTDYKELLSIFNEFRI